MLDDPSDHVQLPPARQARISGFFGAVAMTPVVLWVERLRHGPPKLVTFLPAVSVYRSADAGYRPLTRLGWRS
ncbi:MAG TPA: hypothetical protein VGI00_07240 [Streptosporangiaceae bacterium]|jgi:hypothetical protein